METRGAGSSSGAGAAPRTPTGVTFVELMVGMLLVGVALLGVAASFPYSLHGVMAGGDQTLATLLARQAIELARSTDYDDLPTLGTAGFGAVPGYEGLQRSIDVATGVPTVETTTVTVVVRRVGTIPAPADTTLATIRAR